MASVRDHLSHDFCVSFKEAGEFACVTCPFCCCETYIVDERRRANCGESCSHVCLRCEIEIPSEELSDGALCGWCSHMAEKA